MDHTLPFCASGNFASDVYTSEGWTSPPPVLKFKIRGCIRLKSVGLSAITL